MKEVKIKTVIANGVGVDVFLREGIGGEYSAAVEKDGVVQNPFIKVSVDKSYSLSGVIDILLHEAQELHAYMMGLRLDPSTPSYGSDRFVFVMNHYEFSNLCCIASVFVEQCYEEIKKALEMEENEPGSYFNQDTHSSAE